MKYLCKATVLLTVLLLLNGCIIHSKKYWNEKQNEIYEIRDKWKYEDLENDITGIVLFYNPPYGVDLTWYPAFVIVKTFKNDTCVILDKEFTGELEKNEKITIKPDKWKNIDKESFGTAYFPIKKRRINELQKKVKKVYHGKIEKITMSNID